MKTCAAAVSSDVDLLITLGVDLECIRPIPKSIGPKHQPGGRLVNTTVTMLSRVVGLDSSMQCRV